MATKVLLACIAVLCIGHGSCIPLSMTGQRTAVEDPGSEPMQAGGMMMNGKGSNGTAAAASPISVVLWHGMGDSCCLPMSMGWVKKTIEQRVPGVYVRSLMIGENVAEDQANGFFMPVAKQLEMACNMISGDEKLQQGFHAVGFSQGGLFLRALAQTCSSAKVLNLVSVGGPQQGIFGLPKCTSANNTLCETMRSLLELGAYLPVVQNRLVQAQYWHDPENQARYAKENVFLPGINNQAAPRTPDFAKRLMSLNAFVMVKFTNDTVVVPRESEWFGFYGENGKAIVPLENSPLYTEDWLGLKTMNEAGKLVFLESPGDHLEMPKGWFETHIVGPFLS